MSDRRFAAESIGVGEPAAEVSAASGPRVVVDVLRGPRDLVVALRRVRALAPGALVAILAAPGDGDPDSHTVIGGAAARVSDIVIVSDLPGSGGDRVAARAVLLAGARSSLPRVKPIEIADPAAAIRLALQLAGEVGSVYWGGPGTAVHRDPLGIRPAYSAVADARRALAELDS